MATPFEGLSIIENFSFIFPFLLILVLVWGLLSWIKLFGDNKSVNGLIAVILALITLFSPIVRGTINTMAPWFVLLFFFTIFTLIAFKIFGFSDSVIMDTMSGKYKYINFWIIAIVIIIGIGSLMHVLAERGGVGTSGTSISGNYTISDGEGVAQADQTSAFWNTLVHPKVLGFILIMLIALFTVQRLTSAV